MDSDFLQFYSVTPRYTHKRGLAVMEQLCARLGNPQQRLRCVHIAGTNGKGSCAAMTASILRAAGYHTGLYTSPDLTGPWERIVLDGAAISLPEFARITEEVRRACEGLESPSFFEKLTAAAFLYFARHPCDYVVLETGLGGRLDATNILTNPVVSVIMPIGMDHMAVLGDTLPAIAREKAGIIREGCPVVCAVQEPEALEVIRSECTARHAPLHLVDRTKMAILSRSPSGQTISYDDLEGMELRLLGTHQAENACAVIETARVLSLPETAIRAGLSQAVWPGRFEILRQKPLFLLDGAHNAHGTAALASCLQEYFPRQKFTMVMGAMADKPWKEMLALMEPLAEQFICFAPEGPRALPAAELAAAVRTVPARTAGNLAQLLEECLVPDRNICAFGSLYYIGYLRQLYKEKEKENVHA